MKFRVVRNGLGGDPKDFILNHYFSEFKFRYNRDNLCLFRCIAKIKSSINGKKYTRGYKYMNERWLTHSGSVENKIGIDVSHFYEVCKLFDVSVILLENVNPDVELSKEDEFQKYEDVKHKITIRWKFYTTDGSTGFIDNEDMTQRVIYQGLVVVYFDKKCYYLMTYSNNHYSLLTNITCPQVCDKCGSLTHISNDIEQDKTMELECRNNLSEELNITSLHATGCLFIIFDMETIVKDRQSIPIIINFKVLNESYDTMFEDSIQGFDCVAKFMRCLSYQYGNILKYVIGFYSAKFDNFPLFQYLIRYKNYDFSNKQSIFFKNQLLRLCHYNFITWDLFQFVKSSLKKAAKSYNLVYQKTEMDFEALNKVFENNNYNNSTFEDPEYIKLKVSEYCKNDVDTTAELFKVIRSNLENITNIDPLMKSTISSLMKSFCGPIYPVKLPFSYNHIFDSIPGPRNQTFETGRFTDTEYGYGDINGSYPHIEIEYKFGSGNVSAFAINNYNDLPDNSKLYMAYCDVDQSILPIYLIGVKKHGELNDYTKPIVKNVWLQPETVFTLLDYNCRINFKSCIVWENAEYLLRDKLSLLRDERYKARYESNKVRENAIKVSSNSCFGKTLQANCDLEWKIVRSDIEIMKFKNTTLIPTFKKMADNRFLMMGNKKPSDKISNPRHIGVRILELGRLKLWELMMRLGPKNVKMCDTDGVIATMKSLLTEDLDPMEYGKIKIEAVTNDLIILGNKKYHMTDEKSALSGYQNGSKWVAKKDNEIIHEGSNKSKLLFECLLNKDIVVTSEYTQIRKEFEKKSTGKYNISYIQHNVIDRIL